MVKNEKLLSQWKRFLTTTSKDHKVHWSDLDIREDSRILYGRNPILECLIADPKRLQAVVYFSGIDKSGKQLRDRLRMSGIACVAANSKERIHNLCSNSDHQGFAALAKPIEFLDTDQLISKSKKILILTQIQDPGNLGAIIRNADHFGLDLVVLGSKGSCSFQLSSVSKTSAGAVEHQKLIEVEELSSFLCQLKQNDFYIVGLDGEGDQDLMNLDLQKYSKLAMVLGSEGFGIQGKYAKHLDCLASIERRGMVNSLNVSAASVLASYKLSELR